MNRVLQSVLFFLCINTVLAQSPEATIQKEAIKDHVFYLASDELEGRLTGERGNNLAANYIAHHFEAVGLKKAPGLDSYFQTIPFYEVGSPENGKVSILGETFTQGENLLIQEGAVVRPGTQAELVLAGYGLEDPENGQNDYDGLNVSGKIVVVRYGTPENNSPGAGRSAGTKKRELARRKGAIALIEIYDAPFPWERFVTFSTRPRLTMEEEIPFPHFLIKSDQNILDNLAQNPGSTATLESSGLAKKAKPSHNVIGWVEGTDPILKNEFVLLTAHFDHVGIGQPDDSGDTIYNGTRDNAIGTVAVMTAAETFAKHPAKRSVIFIALTGEERGLLGSRYYAENPLFPLEKTIFNLNIDGAGYNDTSIVTVVGLDRTTAQTAIEEATLAFGLVAKTDPAPEQNLFNRSDNVNFARKGIPAPTFSLGFTAFDDEIGKFYHRPADEPDSIDYDYVLKFCQSYALSARHIANATQAPFWVEGDSYEEVGKSLYNK